MKENWEIHWKDYYKILQVDSSAEPEVIEGAFVRLATKYHPDKNSNPQASERMRELNEAHDILSKPEKKSRYDSIYFQIKQSGKRDIQTSSNYSQSKSTTSSTPKPTPTYYPPTSRKPELTVDEQIALILKMASHRIENKKWEKQRKKWEKNIHEYRKWIDSQWGGVSGIGDCPECKMKSVLETSNESIKRCVNPECHFKKYIE